MTLRTTIVGKTNSLISFNADMITFNAGEKDFLNSLAPYKILGAGNNKSLTYPVKLLIINALGTDFLTCLAKSSIWSVGNDTSKTGLQKE